MPKKTMRSQNGNSCAAHCTVVAVSEISGDASIDADFAETKLWPDIQFKPEAGNPVIMHLASVKNSDPRRIVAEVKKRWPKVNAVMVCDEVQKKTALVYVQKDQRAGLGSAVNPLNNVMC